MKYLNAINPPNIISVITNVPTPPKYRAAATMAIKISSSNILLQLVGVLGSSTGESKTSSLEGSPVKSVCKLELGGGGGGLKPKRYFTAAIKPAM
jgi:hypothetical protein